MAKDFDHVDLSSMSLQELKGLREDLTRSIENFEKRKRLEALAAIEAKAREMGFNLADLTAEAKKGGTAGLPKYVHPENPALTWTGRGRQPNWIKEGLTAGKSLDDFLIR